MNDILLCIDKDETIQECLLANNIIVRTTLASVINELLINKYSAVIISEKFFEQNSLILQILSQHINTNPPKFFLLTSKNYTFHDVGILNTQNLKILLEKLKEKSLTNNCTNTDKNKIEIFTNNIFKLAFTNSIFQIIYKNQNKFEDSIYQLLDILEKTLIPLNLLIALKTDTTLKVFISNNSNSICCSLINKLIKKFDLNDLDINIVKKNITNEVSLINKPTTERFFHLNDKIYIYLQFVADKKPADEILEYSIFYSNLLINSLLSTQKHYYEVTTDYLTKCYNRRFFEETLKNLIKRSKRYKYPYAFISYDIDDFKKINDTFGHITGDNTLIELTTLIKSILRESDVLARFGGEEFAILLPQTNKKGAVVLANKIRKTVANHNFTCLKKHKLTISVGVVCVENNFDIDYNSIYKLVDDAMYEAKNTGKNKVVIKVI
ncbi:GGDEF domain-containing protein [Deferribacter abyssi]|uniref:GGDEF domain-containing protein n=1 Tax=Deferribacter abyssi TaxID=213806 RepID=UPI003C24DCAC